MGMDLIDARLRQASSPLKTFAARAAARGARAPNHPSMPALQALGEGYGGGFVHGGSQGLGTEQLSDARPAHGATPSELMDDGPDPQMHFDLDQMLDVHQETGLGQAGAMDARMLHRWQPRLLCPPPHPPHIHWGCMGVLMHAS